MIRIAYDPSGDIQATPDGIVSPRHARELDEARAKRLAELEAAKRGGSR